MLTNKGPRWVSTFGLLHACTILRVVDCFNDWDGRGYDDFVTGEVTKTTPSVDRTT